MNETEFVRLLESLLQPDTEKVKSATATLNKNYYTSPTALTALLNILISHESSQLRQLAAIEARKLVQKHWNALSADQKPSIRDRLFQSTLNEEATLVRHSSARVISAIAKIDLEDGEWPDLPNLLQQAATSQTARHREVGVYVIFTLFETIGDHFMSNANALFQLLGNTIDDPESMDVRINSMLALSRAAMSLDPEEHPEALKTFQDLVPKMVNVLKATIDSGDEDHIMQAFEVFQTLLGCDAALLQKYFGDLVHFMIDLAAETQATEETRSQALSFLMQCVKYRRLKIQGLRVGEMLTLKSLQIVTELDDSVDEDEDVNPARAALGLLDILASSLPPSQVVVPLLKALGPYFKSEDPQYRRAGVLALGMCCEGAPDFIETQLREILPMILHLLEDPEMKVRVAALNGTARLADELAEEMAQEHEKLIPALIKNFDNAVGQLNTDNKHVIEVVRGCCQALDSLIEGLEKKDAAKYAPELMPRLSQLFDHDDVKTKMSAISAIGAIAAASEEDFSPYFEPIMQKLGSYLQLKESQDDLDLRSAAFDAVGQIASAVGPEKFQKFVGPLMEASEESLQLGHARLRETSYFLWGTMAKLYEENFATYLDGVVKALHESLQQEEKEFEIELGEEAKDLLGAEVVVAGKKIKVADTTSDGNNVVQPVSGNDDDDDDEDAMGDDGDGDDDEDDWEDIGGVTAVAMEKEIAAEVTGDIVTYTKSKYIPYIQKTVEIMLTMVDHSYEGVRKAAISTLWRSYACLWEMEEESGKMEKWKAGIPLQVQPPDDLVKLGRLVMEATMNIWPDEMDRGTVTDINRNIAATLKTCGPAILIGEKGPVVENVVEQLEDIITKRHACQQDLGEDPGEDFFDESSEYDWLVIDTALDTITCLAAAVGPLFAEIWPKFQQPMLKYASSQERYERSAAVGSIADCIGNMGAAVTPYTKKLMAVLTHRLSDEDQDTKSNAVYGVGLLCEKSNDETEVLKNYPTILEKLEPLLPSENQQKEQQTQEARMLDNIAGCISRLIAKHPDRVPLPQVIPRLLQIIPVREDYEENEAVFRMIMQLYKAHNETIMQCNYALAPKLKAVLDPPNEQLRDGTRVELMSLLEAFKNSGFTEK